MNSQTELGGPVLKHPMLFESVMSKTTQNGNQTEKPPPLTDGLDRMPRSRDYAIFPRYLNCLDTIIYIQFYQNVFAVVIDRIDTKIEFSGNFFA